MLDNKPIVGSRDVPEMPRPKAVRALQTSHDIVSQLGNELTTLEKRLNHVSLPNNMTEIRKDAQVPAEPNSDFVNGLFELNSNLQDVSDRISALLELLEI